jgi:hypothetical protein
MERANGWHGSSGPAPADVLQQDGDEDHRYDQWNVFGE